MDYRTNLGRLEGINPPAMLQEGRPTSLRKLSRDIASLHRFQSPGINTADTIY